MLYLKELITKETPITSLVNDTSITIEEKKEALGKSDTSLSKQEEYMKMMYKMNNTWYYFKKEEENYTHPFYLLDELMGSYLATKKGMEAISYFIATIKQKKKQKILGLASKNFKKEGYDYYFGEYFYETCRKDFGEIYDFQCISNLEFFCQERFLNQILELFALDVFMLQKDRKSANVQFQINKITKETNLAPLYDFSNCNSRIDKEGLYLQNCFLVIKEGNLCQLIKKYPYFASCLSTFLEIGMREPFEKICESFHFNQDCEAYEKALSYYQIKEENQRKDLGLYLKK